MFCTPPPKAIRAGAMLGAILCSSCAIGLAHGDRHPPRASATPAAVQASVEQRPIEAAHPARPVERVYVPAPHVERVDTPAPRVERVYAPAPKVERVYTPVPRVERVYAPAPKVERVYAPERRERVYVRSHHAVQHYAPHRAVQEYKPRRVVRIPRVQPRISSRPVARENRAPFVQVIRVAPVRVERAHSVRAGAHAPVSRVAAFARNSTIVANRPVLMSGRVVAVRRNAIVLERGTGRQIVIARYIRYPGQYTVNQYVTVPVVYGNGGYYAYPYGVQYYPPISQWSYPYAGWSGYSPFAGYAPYNWYDAGYGYAYPTPYDSCVWTDGSGDGYCDDAYQNFNGYNGYSYGSYNPFAYAGYGSGFGYGTPLQQVQGLVVAKTGTMLMVLGGNGGDPVFINAAPALQSGFAPGGPVVVGQVVDAYGYYNGDLFVATALM